MRLGSRLTREISKSSTKSMFTLSSTYPGAPDHIMVAAPLATGRLGVQLPAVRRTSQPRGQARIVTIKPDETVAVGETCGAAR